MMPDPAIGLRFAAFAAAQAAKCGEVDPDAVSRLARRAAELLPEDDRLRRAIGDFAEPALEARHRPERLCVLGRELAHVIEVVSVKQPPDLDRRDIHG